MSAFGGKADIPGALILACLGCTSACNPVAHVSGADLLPPDVRVEIVPVARNTLKMVSLAEARRLPSKNRENLGVWNHTNRGHFPRSWERQKSQPPKQTFIRMARINSPKTRQSPKNNSFCSTPLSPEDIFAVVSQEGSVRKRDSSPTHSPSP